MASDDNVKSELVFGIVAAVGTDVDGFSRILKDQLESFKYNSHEIRISKFLDKLKTASPDSKSEYERVMENMTRGNELRKAKPDALALYAITEINRGRGSDVAEKSAYILRSLKHSAEVELLRNVYSRGFFLFSLYARQDDRLNRLTSSGMDKEQALKLMMRDASEAEKWGQQTRKTFPLGDVFIDCTTEESMRSQVERFLDLVFGHPFLTPTRDEYAMFMAHAASLRSGDLSRQVGAVIMSEEGDLISTGANDVPRFPGGLYGPTSDDKRDHVRGYDANEKKRNDILLDLIHRLGNLAQVKGKKQTEHEILKRWLKVAQDSKLFDITEFMRAVHAEMEALLCCARTGASTRGATLYCTTFPCHNCAKHIIAAGIKKVFYVEPYPKSAAEELHSDALSIEVEHSDRVAFLPFIGVGARRFISLFSMNWGSGYHKKRKADGKAIGWRRVDAYPRLQMRNISYLEMEVGLFTELQEVIRE